MQIQPAWAGNLNARTAPAPPKLLNSVNILRGVARAIVVAALVSTVVVLNHQASSRASLRQSALAAATTYGVYVFSYDYRNLTGPDASWTELDEHSTALFRTTFDATKPSLTKHIVAQKVTATAQVVDAGVSSISSARAVVLLFVNQTLTDSAVDSGKPQYQPYRAVITIVRQGGQWLMDSVNPSSLHPQPYVQ